jgi:hypothetical protein
MIDVRLYGELSRYAADPTYLPGRAMHLPLVGSETVGQVLARLGIDPEEISHVFLNGRLLPRSTYPLLLGYPAVAESPLSREGQLAILLGPGDRLGIFPRNMAVVVV